eukprot:4892970-Alexandrium_andersonii.AAC.1
MQVSILREDTGLRGAGIRQDRKDPKWVVVQKLVSPESPVHDMRRCSCLAWGSGLSGGWVGALLRFLFSHSWRKGPLLPWPCLLCAFELATGMQVEVGKQAGPLAVIPSIQ